MPGAGKDVAGMLVQYLRKNEGSARVVLSDLAGQFNVSQPAICYSFKRLLTSDVIRVVSGEYKKGRHKGGSEKAPTISLNSCFMEGDEWRKAMAAAPKQPKTPSGIKAPAPAPLTRSGKSEKSNIGSNKELLQELVNVYGKLKVSQHEISLLESTNETLRSRIVEISEELKTAERQRHQEAEDIANLEIQLRQARQEAGGKKVLMNRNGQI